MSDRETIDNFQQVFASRDRDLFRGERRQWQMCEPQTPAPGVPTEQQISRLREAFEECFAELADDLDRYGAPVTREQCFASFGKKIWRKWEEIQRKGR